MDKTDSMLMRAIAEVAFNGYVDAYGNHTNTMAQIMSQFKPSEDFYAKLEKKIDMEIVAEKIVEKMSNLSSYDRDAVVKRIRENAEKIVSEKIAEKMLADFNQKNTNL